MSSSIVLIQNQECFYQCEPMLKRFEKPGGEGFVQNVLICRTYCEQWFDACKNDMTCVEDWLNGNSILSRIKIDSN